MNNIMEMLESVKEQHRELLVTERRNPLSILHSMLRYKRLVCLRHPVLVELLKYKWKLYGKKFITLFACNFVISYYFIASSNPPREFGLEHQLYMSRYLRIMNHASGS